jgi:hypothetical protein
MLPANGAHTSTNGHRASGPESRVPASASRDHCRSIWKNRETPQSSQRKRCGYQNLLALYCSSRPGKIPLSGLSSRFRAAPQTRCGARAAHPLRHRCHPSASPFPCGLVPSRPAPRQRSRTARAGRASITHRQGWRSASWNLSIHFTDHESARFSRNVRPLYSVRNRPRRCNSGTSRSTMPIRSPGIETVWPSMKPPRLPVASNISSK